jgi:gliding motility-associated-like protein
MLLSVHSIQAAHIIGGDMTYRCVSIDSVSQVSVFEIIVTMYRDSRGGGADFDDPARFGIYRGSGQNWTFLERKRIRPNEIIELQPSENPCITIPPNVGVESGKYSFEVVLDWSNENYKIAYQRCCRNNTISNLVDPQSTGAVFSIDITPEAQRSCNNSPVFDEFPPIVLCANTPATIDISGTDEEGDQIFYEFCLPMSSGGQQAGTGCNAVIPEPIDCLPPFGNIQFALPTYSVDMPLGASSNTNLNSTTGELTLRPSTIGQFVVGVCIKEFRNGQLLSTVTRDFQFNIALCEDLVTADVGTMESGTTLTQDEDVFTLESCFIKTIDFINQSTSQIGDPVYLWEFDINGTKLRDFNTDPTLTFPDVGTYFGSLIVNPQAGVCSDTANIKVIIHPEVKADFEYSYDTCVAGPVKFTDLSAAGLTSSIVNWDWTLSSNEFSGAQNPIHRYRTPGLKSIQLIVEDNNACLDTTIKDISWIPVPDLLVVEPSDIEGCAPIEVFFNNLSEPINESYFIFWDFGDGNVDSLISPTHIYTESGIYNVTLEITSPEGCIISREYPLLIEVQDAPISDFSFSPSVSSSFDPNVQFTNQSQFAEGYEWRFGTAGFSFERNPMYEFPDTGSYAVTLIGYHELGCSDTITKVIDVVPVTAVHMPNAFTPNNDGLNDVFKPVGITQGIRDYQLSIWNRWGSSIFTSNQVDVGWNGEINNAGELVPGGVYIYQVSYKKPRGEIVNLEGHLTLIR